VSEEPLIPPVPTFITKRLIDQLDFQHRDFEALTATRMPPARLRGVGSTDPRWLG
jgi:hypothetical protein